MASRRENKTALAKVRKGRGASATRFGMGMQDREEDVPTKVFGAIAGGILPNPTILKRAAQDPTGTALGAAEVASLASPIANIYRAYKLAKGEGFSVTGAGMEDVEQAAEVGGLMPTGKVVTGPLKVASKIAPKVGRVAEDIALSPVSMLLGSGGMGGGNIARATREAAKATSVSTVRRPSMSLLTDIYSGVSSRTNPSIITPAGTQRVVPEVVADAGRAFIKRFNSPEGLARDVGKKLEVTIKQKQDEAVDDLLDYKIDEVPLRTYLEDAGLPSFRTYTESMLDTSAKPVSSSDVTRNVGIMQRLNPQGAEVESVTIPERKRSKVGWLPYGGHHWENDHSNSISAAKQIIKEQADLIIKGGGQLDSSWFDESQKLLDLVNDPNNVQRVQRVWNQLKSNKTPDEARNLLKAQFPDLADSIGNTDYFDYLFDQWDTLVKTKPFGLSKKGIIETSKRAPAYTGKK